MPDRRTAAFHEAGHAAVLWSIGAEVKTVALGHLLGDDWQGFTETHGDARPVPAVLAGGWAEARAAGRPGEFPEDCDEELDEARAVVGDVGLPEAHIEARRRVEDLWPAIEALAAHLSDEASSIGGEAAILVMTQALRSTGETGK